MDNKEEGRRCERAEGSLFMQSVEDIYSCPRKRKAPVGKASVSDLVVAKGGRCLACRLVKHGIKRCVD